jgi:hypothetical protein
MQAQIDRSVDEYPQMPGARPTHAPVVTAGAPQGSITDRPTEAGEDFCCSDTGANLVGEILERTTMMIVAIRELTDYDIIGDVVQLIVPGERGPTGSERNP